MKIKYYILSSLLLILASCSTTPPPPPAPLPEEAIPSTQTTQTPQAVPTIPAIDITTTPSKPISPLAQAKTKAKAKQKPARNKTIAENRITSNYASTEEILKSFSSDFISKSSYIVYDIDEKKIVEEYQSKNDFIPASTAKIFTAYAGTEILGSSFKFKTFLKKTPKGAIILQGSGDPLLKTVDLMPLVSALKKTIKNKKKEIPFFFDESMIPLLTEIDKGQNDDYNYNTAISGLNINWNQFNFQWKTEKVEGEKTILYTETPLSSYHDFQLSDHQAEFRNEFIKGDSERSWNFSRTATKAGTINLPIRSPGYYSAKVFQQLCAMEGIKLAEPEATSKVSPQSKILATHESPPLSNIVSAMLEHSNNLIAEIIFLKAAAKIKKKKEALNDLNDASLILKKWYKHKETFNLVGGSGLSSQNRVTALGMLELLKKINKKKPQILNQLPVNATYGSLSRRLTKAPLPMHVWAKTGTINFSSTLAGKFYSLNGKSYLFAIMSSDLEHRKLLDENPDKNTSEKKLIPAWSGQARSLQDKLLTYWIFNL